MSSPKVLADLLLEFDLAGPSSIEYLPGMWLNVLQGGSTECLAVMTKAFPNRALVITAADSSTFGFPFHFPYSCLSSSDQQEAGGCPRPRHCPAVCCIWLDVRSSFKSKLGWFGGEAKQYRRETLVKEILAVLADQ